MSHPNRQYRRWLAIGVWLAGLILFAALGWWNVASSRKDADNRLIGEAGRASAQVAALLGLTSLQPDSAAAQAMALAAMDDERIYAIQIHLENGVMEGLRRNYLWEPVPWDDEIAENCVQGMNPIRQGGEVAGRVDVWLSPRANVEDDSLLDKRERLRLILTSLLWTFVFLALLWHWGELRHLRNLLAGPAAPEPPSGGRAEKIVLGLSARRESENPAASGAPDTAPALVDRQLAADFQKNHPEAWLITSGMFRQTFGRGPALIGRLYAEGETAGLCHLGRMLEQAAPSIGARPLEQAAKAMQQALNDPECKTRALPVEACARVLEQTLAALGGKKNDSAPMARSAPRPNPKDQEL